uniref:C2H2-type domain-containing protein n=1 Tax=Bursaphelenchus xylophilus TaxID=6326 RepID=A0A1I7S7D6_BURXY
MECSSICSECKSVFGDLSELQEHLPECLLESYESINWENFSPNVSIYDDGECPVSYIEVETSNLQTEDNRLSAVVSVQIPCEWNGSVCTEIPKRVALPAVDDVPPVIVGSEAVIDGPGLRSDTKMKCPVCHLMLYRHNYTVHFRIHSGERPYQCFFCDRKFRTTSSRKVHHRSHTGERPYRCPHCNYGTVTKRNLDRHIYNQHSKIQYYLKQ